jgi:hypothetical protein
VIRAATPRHRVAVGRTGDARTPGVLLPGSSARDPFRLAAACEQCEALFAFGHARRCAKAGTVWRVRFLIWVNAGGRRRLVPRCPAFCSANSGRRLHTPEAGRNADPVAPSSRSGSFP